MTGPCKAQLCLSLIVVSIANLCAALEPDPQIVARIGADVKYLASDELAGRGVGTDGIVAASEFIARRFSDLGLQTNFFDGTAFQRFAIKGATQVGATSNNFLIVENMPNGGSLTKFQLAKDFNPLALGANGGFSGTAVFAGYGITANEYKYDDYANVDVAGKVVIVLRKEPQQKDSNSKFAGTRNSDHAPFTKKVLNAATHKAAALIVVNDSLTVASYVADLTKKFDEANARLETLARSAPSKDSSDTQQKQWKDQVQNQTLEVESLRQRLSGNPDLILSVNEAGTALSNKQVPTLFCSRAVIDPLLLATIGKSLAQLEQEIDQDLQPRSNELQGIKFNGEVLLQSSQTPVQNVIGFLPGVGELASEYVVVGAHYDHVGMGGMGSLAPGTIAVHNGADDNASGTAAMLEIARQCAALPQTPRRSLIFMAFTAEESGLLGSKHYVRNPRWPLEKTVAMVNLDMVGRLTKNELSVYGTGTSPGFAELIDKLNAPYQYKIIKESSGRGPSDHTSFYEQRIPVLHFFTGLHDDYHRPGDDFEKINLPELAQIAKMVADVTQFFISQSARPEYQSTSGSARPRRQNSQDQGRR